jgi:hypothetical protein
MCAAASGKWLRALAGNCRAQSQGQINLRSEHPIIFMLEETGWDIWAFNNYMYAYPQKSALHCKEQFLLVTVGTHIVSRLLMTLCHYGY